MYLNKKVPLGFQTFFMIIFSYSKIISIFFFFQLVLTKQ